jgi:biotin transport system substrate-specific component
MESLRSWPGAAAFTALTGVCSQFACHVPMTPVPVTLQVFAVLFSGLALGPRWGAVAQAQYLLLGLAGAPVFALGHAGPAAILGITGGYLVSYPAAAAIAGSLADRARSRHGRGGPASLILAAAAGLACIYTGGCLWLGLMIRPALPLAAVLVQGAGWFLAWDAVKAALAVGAAEAVSRRR